MKHRCDTWKDCGDSTCRHAKSHGECWRSRGPTKCSTANCLVRCNPILEETHTCYYCNHEGPDVNRIAGFKANRRDVFHCCDDAVVCDHRWQEG